MLSTLTSFFGCRLVDFGELEIPALPFDLAVDAAVVCPPQLAMAVDDDNSQHPDDLQANQQSQSSPTTSPHPAASDSDRSLSLHSLSLSSSSQASSPSQPYVYPVRSLLSGVQPASQISPSTQIPGVIGTIGSPPPLSISQVAEQLRQIDKSFVRTRPDNAHSDAISGTETPFIPLASASASEGYFSRQREASSPAVRSPTNAPDLPTVHEGQPLQISSIDTVKRGMADEADGQRVVILSGDREPSECDPHHSEPLASAGFATAYTTPTLRQPKAMHPSQPNLDPSGSGSDNCSSDFSMSGIVHLPPLPSRSGSERGSSVSGNISGGSFSSNKPNSNQGGTVSGSGSDSRGISRRLPREVRHASNVEAVVSGEDSQGDSAGDVEERSVANSSQSELVTFRFEHVVDEDGFHVLTGREGSLTRCEDEVRIFPVFLAILF